GYAIVASNDEARATLLLKIVARWPEPEPVHPSTLRRVGDSIEVAGPQSKPMVRLPTSIRGRGLDRVKPQHLAITIRPSPRGEIAGAALEARKLAAQEIRVEREHHISGAEVIARFHHLAEGLLRAQFHVVTIDRVPDMPLHL